MYNKILIRYGELTLKGKNRVNFIDTLASNIRHKTKDKLEVEFDRMFLPYSQENLDALQYIFGITSYSPVIICANDIEEIKKQALNLAKNKNGTFKVAARRNNKSFQYQSSQINNIVGGFLLENNQNLKVDVNNPDFIVYIEVRGKFTYVFSDFVQALGGLPVGVSGQVLHLMSGGIDSPVAAFQLMKRGLKVNFLSFITPPQTDQATVNKMKELIKILTKYQNTSTFYLANYSTLMNYIALVSNQAYKITLMRRSFYRIAAKLAQSKKNLAISNGENLGQVASQTLESLYTISHDINMPILRPLLTNDKIETINLAKKIQTYDLSITKCNETCELFAPKEPVTKPNVQEALKLEEELNMINDLEKECLEKNIEIIKF
ncbi:tRNA uracil 4-sulfurtransferase ThiI [Mycoplasmopsis fermentans]|uniref:Probable tRNA sulfurtransferase n=1 Tax=Mycoplasmopsis fermentans (strain M64) TaxID=943945 RepID=A0AB32XCZ2_MYCFM|nr:tRNA uracil 4-sulfurtransferase ThiI [Mycoplasmopsis fermentans]VEU67216.1 thiamine biosynthesis ATP pyrophosphatase [Mesomycoplasma conjunctivae]ADN69209.1 thiamine biosynthesis ATP pyrophosphatase [Mycoplasmopsis fermentans JER]ADV34741.1 Probable thiamine biosynthesis protein ThiI [Mycoplasmopsis fermentans M64]RMX34976.1 tRNA sulfurtransferase ThiI [Mycoplasmopsis fermentans MF-I1]RMX35081.1 tRNA sulfurtransferase ThiI [Mycoplasmopsis fermentans MF-I2]